MPEASRHDLAGLFFVFCRRLGIENTFRFLKQTLSWTRPKVRAAGVSTWLVIAAHTRLRLAQSLADRLRRPWQKPQAADSLAPARARRGFRRL